MRQCLSVTRGLLAMLLIAGLILLAIATATQRHPLTGSLDSLVAVMGQGLERLARDHGWVVREVTVVGAEGPARPVIEKALAGIRGQPMVAVSPQAVLRRLLAEPWVRDARIARHWPDRLVITVVVRHPAAVLIDRQGGTLIAADGTRLGPAALAVGMNGLPRIAGADAPAALAELLAWRSRYPQLFAQLDHAVRVGRRRWDLVLNNGLRILLPERGSGYGPEQALARLVDLEGQDHILARSLSRIDLRLADRIFFAPAAAKGTRVREQARERNS